MNNKVLVKKKLFLLIIVQICDNFSKSNRRISFNGLAVQLTALFDSIRYKEKLEKRG